MPRPDFLKPLNFFFFAILPASGYLISSGKFAITVVLLKIVLSMLFLTTSANIFNEFSTGRSHCVMKIFNFKSKNAIFKIVNKLIAYSYLTVFFC